MDILRIYYKRKGPKIVTTLETISKISYSYTVLTGLHNMGIVESTEVWNCNLAV